MSAPALRALIFDFDGTLLDTEIHEYEGWRALYASHGLELPLARWQEGVGTAGGFDPWAGLPVPAADRGEVAARLDERIHAAIEAAELRPGVRVVLEEARAAGLKLAVASSSHRAWVVRWLERHGLLGAFDALATADDVARVKPDPALYGLALERLGVRPAEALAVEDSLNGATGAHRAGLRVVVTPNDVTRNQAFPPEWPRLDGLSDLEALVRAGGARLSERTPRP